MVDLFLNFLAAILGLDGHWAHQRAPLAPSPGSPKLGCALPHSHLLLLTSTASSGRSGHWEHQRAPLGPPPGSPK